MQVILIRSFTSDTDFLRMRTRNSFALKQACAGHYVPPNLLSEKKGRLTIYIVRIRVIGSRLTVVR